MKSILLILVSILCLSSCVKVTRSEPYTIEGKMVARHHEDSKTEYGFHYGYDAFRGKRCTHYGPETISEKNKVSFTFLNDTITYDNRTLYNKPRVVITYKRVYHDGIFHHNQIIKIE